MVRDITLTQRWLRDAFPDVLAAVLRSGATGPVDAPLVLVQDEVLGWDEALEGSVTLQGQPWRFGYVPGREQVRPMMATDPGARWIMVVPSGVTISEDLTNRAHPRPLRLRATHLLNALTGRKWSDAVNRPNYRRFIAEHAAELAEVARASQQPFLQQSSFFISVVLGRDAALMDRRAWLEALTNEPRIPAELHDDAREVLGGIRAGDGERVLLEWLVQRKLTRGDLAALARAASAYLDGNEPASADLDDLRFFRAANMPHLDERMVLGEARELIRQVS